MNGQKARNLRKLVAEQLEHLPLVQYEKTKEHKKLFPTGATNFDGTPQLIPLDLFTIELVGCQRKVYQKAKRLHNQFYGKV